MTTFVSAYRIVPFNAETIVSKSRTGFLNSVQVSGKSSYTIMHFNILILSIFLVFFSFHFLRVYIYRMKHSFMVSRRFVLCHFNSRKSNRCNFNRSHFQPLAFSIACHFNRLQLQPRQIQPLYLSSNQSITVTKCN